MNAVIPTRNNCPNNGWRLDHRRYGSQDAELIRSPIAAWATASSVALIETQGFIITSPPGRPSAPGRRDFHQVVLVDLVPNRKKDSFVTNHLASNETIEFMLSPVLFKESPTEHNDAESGLGQAARSASGAMVSTRIRLTR